ncbi:MAG: hypothetical protein E7520_02210 [Ruminococcaceae bacterium]|nr:hypothetical protein [Oscillospiraceae bacterium]
MNKKNRRFSAIVVALVFALVSFGAAVSFADDSVAIETAFTDPVFRDAIALRYDTDKDGKLSPDERSTDTMVISGLVDALAESRGIDSDTLRISSIEGIEYFDNLTTLYCNNIGELGTMDVSALTKLETLSCSDDGLTSLDLSANTELRFLHCCSNEFQSLDFTANTKLEFLHCYANLELKSLNVSGLEELGQLRCDGCQLSALDLSSNPSLYVLNCSYNRLAKMDLSSTAAANLTDYHLGNQRISLELIYADGLIKAPLDLDANAVYSTSLDTEEKAFADGAFFTADYEAIKDGFTYLYDTGKDGCAEMKVTVSVSHTHAYAITASDFENKTLIINCQICGEEEHVLDATLSTETAPADCINTGLVADTLTAEYNAVTYTDVKETVLNALGHHYETAVTPPTCTEQGYTTYTCTRGDDTYVDHYTDPNGHTDGTPVKENEIPATCTEDGSFDEVVYCTVCNAEISRTPHTVKAPGHTEVPISAVAPTCTEPGLTAGVKCAVCEEILTAQEPVKALGHDFGAWTETTPAVSPGCTTPGSTAVESRYCSRCDAYETKGGEPIAAPGHTEEVIPAVAPTCTEPGLTAGVKCSVCGEILTAQEPVEALTHDYKAVVTPPTCTEQGYTTYTCTRGDDTYVDDYTDPNGHTDGAPVKENEIPATCTEDGSFDEVVYCTVCHAEISRNHRTIDALKHLEQVIPAVAPTCTKTGLTEGLKCSRCGEIFIAQESVPANEHTWDKGTVTVEPTVQSTGTRKYTCTVCKATRTETIPKLTVAEVTPTESEADKASVNKNIKKPAKIHTISYSKKKQYYIYFSPVKGAQNYRVMYRKQGAKKWTKAWTKGKTEFTIKNLKLNGLYEFKFAAYKKNAKGKWERGEYSTTSRRYYFKETITKVTVKKQSVTIKWKRDKSAKYYKIEYATNKDMKNSRTITNISPNSKTSYTIKGLKKGKKYYIRVRAIKRKAGYDYIGEYSNKKTFTIKK